MAIKYNCNFRGTLPFSDVTVSISITTNLEQTYTVPGDATFKYQVLYAYNDTANVYVRLNGSGAATVPTPNSAVQQQYMEFRPYKRYVQGGDVLHFITPDAIQYLGISLRQISG